jgi:hypothetical protein
MTVHLVPAATVVLLAAGIAVGASYAEGVLLLAVLGAQALAAATWHRAAGLPGARVGAAVALVAAATADGVVVAADDDRPLRRLAGVLALVVIAGIGQQLLRPPPRRSATASFAATVTVAVLCVLGSVYLAVADLGHGAGLVAAAALPAAAVALVMALPGPGGRRRRPPAALAAGLLAATVVAAAAALPAYDALVVGAAATGVGWVGALLARRLGAVRAPAVGLAVAAVPLLTAAPVAYVLGRLLLG